MFFMNYKSSIYKHKNKSISVENPKTSIKLPIHQYQQRLFGGNLCGFSLQPKNKKSTFFESFLN